MGGASNTTCHKHVAADPPSLFQNGNVVFQAHHVGWIVCGAFASVATVASFWLIDKHLQWYTNKREQRYIVRLLFLVPIYALISFASFLFWNHSTPLVLLRDAYEAIVLTAFFYLLLMYISPDVEEQKRVFLKSGLSRVADTNARQKGEKVQRWMFPLSFIKWKPRDGLFFLQLMKWGVLQYCVVRPTTTLAAVILDYAGLYCESSWSPVWGHIWIVITISVSVSIAMYCLIQLYMPISKVLAQHRPLLKLFSVKAVVFLTFWQATFLSVLSMFGVVKDTKYMTAEDINIGIGAILETFEMMIFAFVHIKAFTYKAYRPVTIPMKQPPPTRTPRFRSLAHAMDFRETFREIWIGCIYMLDKLRGREPTPDFGVRRAAHYEEAFGRPRPSHLPHDRGGKGNGTLDTHLPKPATSPMNIAINQHVDVDVGGEHQWLGTGDDYGYGLGYFQRQRSEGLAVQIEQELERRGYPSNDSMHAVYSSSTPNQRNVEAEPYRRQRSWWRTIYDRISQTDHDDLGQDGSVKPSLPRRLQSRSRRHSEAQHHLLHEADHDLEDLPPISIVRPEDSSLSATHQKPSSSGGGIEGDVLSPLSVYRERRRSYQPKPENRHLSIPAPLHHLVPSLPYPMPNFEAPAMREQGRDETSNYLSMPSSNYGRSDSLLNRIFPPSEGGSINDNMRETDSAYSIASVSAENVNPAMATPRGRLILSTPEVLCTDEFGITGDRRLLVHDNVVHPSRSMNAIHTPWIAHIVNSDSESTPPPLPTKDYVPTSRRSHQRETENYRSRATNHSSLASLPEDSQTSESPFPVMKTFTVDQLVASPTGMELQSPFREQRQSTMLEPRTPPLSHRKALRRSSADVSGIPVSITGSRPIPSPRPTSMASRAPLIQHTNNRPTQINQSGSGQVSSRNILYTDIRHSTPTSPRHRNLQIPPRLSIHVSEEPPRRDPPRPRQPIDSDDFSDLSTNSFYSAVSQPHGRIS